ncbi:PQQ-binding-like beta-propeller repeat protein [Colwelliaceae bacterium MEBiC 14330]
MKYRTLWSNLTLGYIVNILLVMALTLSTNVMASTSSYSTEVCSGEVVEAEIGRTADLSLPTGLPAFSIGGNKITWETMLINGVSHSLPFAPSQAHLGSKSVTVLGKKSNSGNLWGAPTYDYYTCSKTLTVRKVTNPSIVFDPMPPSEITLNTEITLNVNAHDDGKNITKVAFFKGVESNGNVDWHHEKNCLTPYNRWTGYTLVENLSCALTWSTDSQGDYLFKAQATDSDGNKSPFVEVSIEVKEQNTLPTVTLSLPSENVTLKQGVKLSLAATATDNDKSAENQLNSFKFCYGDEKQNSCNTIAANCTVVSGEECTTSIALTSSAFVWAEANDGHSTVKSIARSVTLDKKPEVDFKFKDEPYALLGSKINFEVSPSDDVKVDKVQICYGAHNTSCHNELKQCLAESGSSCTDSITADFSAGTYNIFAVVTDSNNQKALSAITPLTVYSGQGVMITSPNLGDVFDENSTINVTAKTEAILGVENRFAKVDFYLDGGSPAATVTKDCNDNTRPLNDEVSASIQLGKSKEHDITAVVTDCHSDISRHSAAIKISTKEIPPDTPIVKAFSDNISNTGLYTVELTPASGVITGYRWYENNASDPISTTILPELIVEKGYTENGEYSYCAQAYNNSGSSPIGTGNQCQSIQVQRVQAVPEKPAFNHISLQQPGSYVLSWSTNVAQAAYFELWGGSGTLADLEDDDWQLLSGSPETIISQYKAHEPSVGNYSYQLKACNLQQVCTKAQLTINHQAPYLQNAAFEPYFDSFCGADCLILTGIALTKESIVSIQVRNSTESFSFSGDELIAVDENTLKVKANKRIKDGLSNGGIAIELSNSILNANSATIVLDHSGANDRFDLINRAPTVSDNNTIYVGIENNIYSLNPQNGDTKPGWPYVTNGNVVAAPTLSKNQLAEDIIYVGSKDHHFYALHQSGDLLWKTKTLGEVIASAEIDENNQLYVGSMDKALYAMDAATGAIQWQYPFPMGISQKPELSGDGLVYVTTDDQQIHIINRRNVGTQALRWQDIDDSLISGSLAEIENWQPSQGQVPHLKVIARLFYAILQRAPSERELSFFAYASDMGISLEEITNAFLNAEQGKINFPSSDSNSEFLNKLYEILFPNGAPGLVANHEKAHWLTKLNQGYTRAAITVELVASTEYGAYADDLVLALLSYFYDECQLAQGCEYQGDTDGDGNSDYWENNNGYNPLDPSDTIVAIPTVTATVPSAGEFTLNIEATGQISHFKILQSIGTEQFTVIEDTLESNSITLIKAAGSYRYQVVACIGQICSAASSYIEVTISNTRLEAAISPESVPQTPADSEPPTVDKINASAKFMATSGNFRVTENGSASYDLPIALPAGIAGVTPSLALSYDSQRGESSAGVGWVVAAGSAISRCRQTQVTDGQFAPLLFNENDRYCLDGQRLILVAHDNASEPDEGTIGAHYRTEIDNGLKISVEEAENGVDTVFIVKGLDGSVKTYGGTENSTDTRNKGTLTWLLHTVTDNLANADNTITYTYQHDDIGSHEIVLSTIEYSGNSVELNYQAGKVRSSHYLAGELVTSMAELTGIDVFNHNDEKIRHYTLTYDDNAIDKRELKSIKECRDLVCKQPVSFTYRPTSANTDELFPQHKDLIFGKSLAASIVQDVNSDGKNDVVSLEHLDEKNYQLCVAINESNRCVDFERDNDNEQVPIVLTDTDNDGWAEILVMMSDYVNGTSFQDPWEIITFTDGNLNQPISIDIERNTTHSQSLRSFDFDGDGHNDLISAFEDELRINYWDPVEQRYTNMTVIDNFTGDISASLNQKDIFNGSWQASDFNGDGRGDIITWVCQNSCDDGREGDKLYIFTSNGDDLDLYYKKHISGHSVMSTDFNGDGFSDLMFYNIFSDNWQIYLNTAKNDDDSGSFSTSNVLNLATDTEVMSETGDVDDTDIEFSDEIMPVIADLDGDGNIEVILYADNKWYSAEWSPEDNHFNFNSEAVKQASLEKGDSAYVTDWDNDGRQDFIIKNKYSVTASMNMYSPNMPGLLDSVEQANGLNTSIEYGPMHDTSLYEKGTSASSMSHSAGVRTIDVVNSMPLVKAITRDTPSTEDATLKSQTTYQYKGAQVQLGGRGWLGFAEIITSSSKDGHTLTDSTKFQQAFPYTGMPISSRQNISDVSLPISESKTQYTYDFIEGLSNHYYRVYADDSRSCQANVSRDSGLTLSVEHYNCNQTLVNKNANHDVTESLTSTYVADNSTDFLALPDESTAVNSGWPSFTQSKVLVSLTDWLSQTDVTNIFIKPGRLTDSQVVHRRKDQTDISRKSSFIYYPSESLHADMLWQEIVEPEGDCASYLKTTHTYDNWGNTTEKRVTNKAGCENAINRASITVYDDAGRYPVSVANDSFTTKTILSRNALGQPTKVANTDNMETDMLYGPFGSLVHTYNASGSQSTQLNQACDLAHCYMQTVSSKNGDILSVNYIDMAGNTFQRDITQVLGGTLTSYHEFDRYGREYSTQAPGLLAVTRSFDVFDRLISENDNNTNITTSVTINGFSQTTTLTGDLPDGSQSTTTTLNSFGENSTVTDNVGNILTYTYNSVGKLSTVHSSADDIIVVENIYDNLGRKKEMHDKNMGSWHYVYNALGELVEQTDANLTVTTNHYDNLGRKEWQMVTGEPTSYWHYSGHQLTSESAGDWQRHYKYDFIGRNVASLTSLDSSTDCIAGVAYNTNTNDLRITDDTLNDPVASRCVIQQKTFDNYGRVFQQFDDYRRSSNGDFVEARGIRYHYAYGKVLKQQEAREGEQGRIYTETVSLNAFGGISEYRKGSRIINVGADDAGRANSISSGDGDYIQQDSYTFDGMGNLKSRTLTTQAEQIFGYDGLNRLTTVNGSQRYHYKDNGNFDSKDGWAHSYGEDTNSVTQPIHALTSRTKDGVTESFFYDKNGNQLSAKSNGEQWRTVEYNGRNKATYIDEDGEITRFSYDANNNRYKRTSAGQTIYYVGALELTIDDGSETQAQQSYIKRTVAGQALQTYYSAGNAQLKWLYKDILGSLVAITNDEGELLKRFSYDAFGKQEEIIPTPLDSLNYALSLDSLILAKVPMNIRGYTGHEPVGTNGRIIHMNGRIYDAALGRFMQADPHIQAPSNSQSFNRYSYVLNNPLSYTDPSGYFFKKLWKKIKPFVGAIAAIAVAAWCTACSATIWSAAMTGAAIGAGSAAINGGNVLKGALIGAFSGAAFQQIGAHFTGAAEGSLGHIAAHGITGGITSVLQGGKFAYGFISAGLTKALNINNIVGTAAKDAGLRVAMAAVVGGTISRLTGGKFANGAITAAFAQLFNGEEAAKRAEVQKVTKQITRRVFKDGAAVRSEREVGKAKWEKLVTVGPIVDKLAKMPGSTSLGVNIELLTQEWGIYEQVETYNVEYTYLVGDDYSSKIIHIGPQIATGETSWMYTGVSTGFSITDVRGCIVTCDFISRGVFGNGTQ